MYRNQKGQGLTEYGIILLLVLLIGVAVWFHFDVRGELSGIYQTISSDLSSIIGEKQTADGSEYDTGVNFTVSLQDLDKKIVRSIDLHQTSLFASSVFGATNSVYWYTEDDGTKTYISSPYSANLSPVNNGVIANMFKLNNYDSNGSDTYYFKNPNTGKYYEISGSGSNVSLQEYTGAVSSIPKNHLK